MVSTANYNRGCANYNRGVIILVQLVVVISPAGLHGGYSTGEGGGCNEGFCPLLPIN